MSRESSCTQCIPQRRTHTRRLKCHLNTRIAFLNKIMGWILGHGVDDQDAVILWFYRPAGAGKSAIMLNYVI